MDGIGILQNHHFMSSVVDNNLHSLNGYYVESFLVLHKHYLIKSCSIIHNGQDMETTSVLR